MAIPKWVWQEGPQTESLLGILLQLQGGCWCVFAGSPTSWLVLLQPWSAPLPIGFFLERAVWGDLPPAHRSMWAFSYPFYMISFIYYLRGLGFLALDTSPHFSSLPKKGVDGLNWQKKNKYILLLGLLATPRQLSLNFSHPVFTCGFVTEFWLCRMPRLLAVVPALALNMDPNLDLSRTLKEDFTMEKLLYAGQMLYHTSSLLMNCTKKVSGSPLLVCKE